MVSSSGRAFGLLQSAASLAQWIAMPTKSVCARARAAVFEGASCEALPSFHSLEFSPKTRVMSPEGSVWPLFGPLVKIAVLFSSSMFAAETPPTLQPACVNASHGGVTVCCPSPTMFGRLSSAPSTVSVQYLNDELNAGVFVALK